MIANKKIFHHAYLCFLAPAHNSEYLAPNRDLIDRHLGIANSFYSSLRRGQCQLWWVHGNGAKAFTEYQVVGIHNFGSNPSL